MDAGVVNLPPGDVAITVKLINTVNFGPSILTRFMTPMVPGLETFSSVPSLSFLLEHPSGRKFVWDLGIRPDYENYSPTIAEYIPTTNYNIQVEKDVADVLQDHGIPPKDIEAIFWSHWHWDHIGNPDRFPKSTALIVGQGFKEAMLPGAPANPKSPILESDYSGRGLKQIEFGSFRVGQFPAHDFFGDGSFYLLDSPGHAIGHLCGLARTTPDTFVLLGGDVCHYAGIFRPSRHLPVPSSISPHPFAHKDSFFCPGHAWEELQKSRGRTATDSLFEMTFGHDIPLATETKRKLQELDCNDNILVVIAHDASVRDHVDHFPKSLNDWKAKGWGRKLRWDFFRELLPYWQAKGLA